VGFPSGAEAGAFPASRRKPLDEIVQWL
jgi:hypothetical protein